MEELTGQEAVITAPLLYVTITDVDRSPCLWPQPEIAEWTSSYSLPFIKNDKYNLRVLLPDNCSCPNILNPLTHGKSNS